MSMPGVSRRGKRWSVSYRDVDNRPRRRTFDSYAEARAFKLTQAAAKGHDRALARNGRCTTRIDGHRCARAADPGRDYCSNHATAHADFEASDDGEAGWVYIITAEGTDRIKIGWTTRPVDLRLGMLQTGSPVTLAIAAAVPARRSDENELHRELAAHRLHGEWFDSTVSQAQAALEAVQQRRAHP